MTNYQLIQTAPALQSLLKILQDETLIAVDTESDSLYSYFEKVCLVQISTAEANYIVDPLAVDISPLGDIFANPAIEIIFHAAEYDLISLHRDYGFSFNNLFDTMVSARILGWPRFGLSSLLEAHFGVQLNKRFQRYNWGQRPLAKNALEYAYQDTCYLIPLRNIQLAALTEQNRLKEARSAFKRAERIKTPNKVFSADDFWQIKEAKSLTPHQQAILQALYVFRDEYARQIDKPAFKVMNNHTMVNLTLTTPSTIAGLEKTKGLNKTLIRKQGKRILAILQADYPNPPRYKPKRKSRKYRKYNEEEQTRYERLRTWRNRVAAERGVEPDVVLSNNALMAVARLNPDSRADLATANILGPWQLNTYGQTLVEVLNGENSQ